MSGRRIGNYLIVDYLGGGGFGSVFKAEDTSTPGRIVAIKELHKKHTRSAVIKQRFFQEAIAMAKLDHANLPRLYTFGEDNGSYYLVMEFISGKLLTDEIHEKGQLPPHQALSIITQALDAVSYAHRNGIIHRDLKPDNIMLYGDSAVYSTAPKVKVLDFGIARLIGGENLTMAGEGFGTPIYMSPERIAGDNQPDQRSDLYSLGIILYEMLAGRPPFQSSSTDPLVYWSEMRALHESHELPPLEALGIPPEIERIIRKATAKTKAERYAAAEEMLADVRAVLESGAISTAPAAGGAHLLITTVPGAADIYLDGTLRGSSDAATGKLLLEGVAPGAHTLRVSKAGYSEYGIGVVLDEGQRTDLQVPLAARSTMMMAPSGDATNPFDAQTVRMESGDDVATAMLTVEGIPVGSQVFVGAKPMAFAGEDGRATLRLEPGVHELQVTTPSGAIGKQVVTLTQKDTGSLRTMAMPVPYDTDGKPATATAATPQQTDPSAAGKRVATAVAAILLLALVVSAFFVLRKPAPVPVQNPATLADANPTPPADPGATASLPEDTTEAERAAINKEREELERERRELEKKRQALKEAEAASKEGKKEGGVPASAPVAPVPPAPDPLAPPSGETGCVAVRVINLDGQPQPAAKVMFISTSGTDTRRTGPNGMCNSCSFTVGSKVSILAFGPDGIPSSRKVVVSSGRTGIEIKLGKPIPGMRPGESFTPPDGAPPGRRSRRYPPPVKN